jgi:chemotaxis protein histidine kinase CheA
MPAGKQTASEHHDPTPSPRMTTPPALLEFFQKEAIEYLERMDRVLADAVSTAPEATAFVSHARALRGSAAMTSLDGLADVAATMERIAISLRDGALRWDPRLQQSLREVLTSVQALVQQAPHWSEREVRQCRSLAVSLATTASSHLAGPPPIEPPAGPVIPIARLFPDDGHPAILERNPTPAMTLARRFRVDLDMAAELLGRECAQTLSTGAEPPPVTRTDALRRALMGLAELAESYAATSIAGLATRMARAPLATAHELQAIQQYAQVLRTPEYSDTQLAQQVKQAALAWSGAPSAPPSIVPIESLLYRGGSALQRAKILRDQLAHHWQRGTVAQPEAHALFEELSDLLDLAGTT